MGKHFIGLQTLLYLRIEARSCAWRNCAERLCILPTTSILCGFSAQPDSPVPSAGGGGDGFSVTYMAGTLQHKMAGK